MVSVMRHDSSLGDALLARAQRASMRRLKLDVCGGLLTFSAAAAWKPTGWMILACAALCFATFGAWGLAERLLNSPGRVSNHALTASLMILRTLAIAVGAAAFLLLLFGGLEIAMGTWIS